MAEPTDDEIRLQEVPMVDSFPSPPGAVCDNPSCDQPAVIEMTFLYLCPRVGGGIEKILASRYSCSDCKELVAYV